MSEFIALKTATELVEYLRYKLWMFCIPVEGPTNMFYDNEAVYKNVSSHESALKKKNVIIFYRKCREVVAAAVARISKEGAATNFPDTCTNILVHIRRETLLDRFTC